MHHPSLSTRITFPVLRTRMVRPCCFAPDEEGDQLNKGACFIGLMVAIALYGITSLQTYFYYVQYPKDRAGFKALVGTMWILDTLHTILGAYTNVVLAPVTFHTNYIL
jgi:hypothetical protein